MTQRMQAIAEKLDSTTAALISAPHHLRFLCGYPSTEAWLFLTRDAAYFLTDFRYIELAEQTVQGAECRMIGTLAEALPALVERHGITAVVAETADLTAATYARFAKAIPLVEGELDAWLSELRECKTEEEIGKIEQAQAIAEAAFAHILEYIHEGVTEREVALELEFYMRRAGATRAAFDIIVAAGASGSVPHAIPSDKPIRRGDLVTMDFGAVVDGYHSDMTRTVAIGEVSERQKLVYDTVLRAQKASLAVLKAGVSCVEGDAAARRVIEEAGFGQHFGHGTGHGVGLEIHEEPRLSPRAGEKLLRVGQVVTVEPGIYLPGECGVRIEDMALITETGCRNLTHAPKELICL